MVLPIQVVNLCAVVAEIFSAMCFFDASLGRKYYQKAPYIITKVIYIIIIVFSNSIVGNSSYISIVAIISLTVISQCLYKKNVILKFLFTVMFYAILVMIDLITIFWLTHLFKCTTDYIFSEPTHFTFMVVLAKTLLYTLSRLLGKLIGKEINIKLKRGDWFLVYTVPVLSLMTVILLLWNNLSNYNVTISTVVALMGLMAINIILFYIIERISVQNYMEVQNKMLLSQVDMQFENITSLKDTHTKIRQIYHDFNNHITCMHSLLENNNFEEAKKYVRQIQSETTAQILPLNTNNMIVDAVLNQKYIKATQQKIDIQFKVNNLNSLSIDEIDIVTILANAIDNAIEASAQTENKYIDIKIMNEPDSLLIVIKNSCKEPVMIQGNHIATSKEDTQAHGFGLSNIRQAVDKYHGQFDLRYEEGFFYFICNIAF